MKRLPFTAVIVVPANVAVHHGEVYIAWCHGAGRTLADAREQAAREAREDFAAAYGLREDTARLAIVALVMFGHHRDVLDSVADRRAAKTA